MGVGTGAGEEGGTHAQRGGGTQRRRPTGRHSTRQQYVIVVEWVFRNIEGADWPATKTSRNRVVVPARQATQPGGIGSLKSLLGLLKSLDIRALNHGQQ